MGMERVIPVLLPCLVCGCTIIHDLDPDGLPVRDGAADAPDGLLDADGADPLVDPDHEGDPLIDSGEDCPPTPPFRDTCSGSVDCLPGEEPPSTCNVGLIQFNSPAIEGDFMYQDHDVTDACASLCECRGFIKMQVDAETEHGVGGGMFSTPSVSYDMGGTTDPFTITTRIINDFLYAGQKAGLYVIQDSVNVLSVTVDRPAGDTEIFIDLDIPGGHGYYHPDTIPGSTTDVTLSIQRIDDISWRLIINDTPMPIDNDFSLIVHEVGIATGNDNTLPLTAALFDYVCINQP